jgi:Mg2+ and Co2+ transporter CorA
MAVATPASLTIAVVTADGVRQGATSADTRDLVASGRYFWIDLVGGIAAERAAILDRFGLDAADLAWAQRFGQAGRMTMNRQRLRAVTWLSQGVDQGLTEIHVLCFHRRVVTVWNGDTRVLDSIRQRIAERMAELDESPHAVAAILLQMLLATLHTAVGEVDERLQAIQSQIRTAPTAVDSADLESRMQRLQTAWSAIDHYSTAVTTALIGVEAVPGIDKRGADELNDYAEQVEDLAHRLQDRSRRGEDLLRDHAGAISRWQGEQIGRLTLVSVIFLPITFLTGFFGMNFPWMVDAVKGPAAFLMLGVLAPTACVIATVLWIMRRVLK